MEQYPVRGVDVSEYQGNIHWETVEEQGMRFAFIKATEGSAYVDPFFHSNWENIAATSLLCGAYHFFSFDSPAATQADNFIETVGQRDGMLPPVVDIELYGPHKKSYPEATAVRAQLNLLLDALEEYYGEKPILYATQQSYSLYLAGFYSDYPLWIRDVFFTPHFSLGEEWTFWQYTDKGKLAGYDGPEKYIDINVFSHDFEALKKMCV